MAGTTGTGADVPLPPRATVVQDGNEVPIVADLLFQKSPQKT